MLRFPLTLDYKPIKATFEKSVFWYIHDSEYSQIFLTLSIYMLHLCLEDTLKVSFNMYLPLIFNFPPGNPATHLKILLEHSGKNTATDVRYIMCCKNLWMGSKGASLKKRLCFSVWLPSFIMVKATQNSWALDDIKKINRDLSLVAVFAWQVPVFWWCMETSTKLSNE